MALILIVDDSTLTQAFAQSVLQSMGHTIILAQDGVEGLAIAREENPDIIISGLSLPALDGLSVFRILREEGCRAPFIVIGEMQSDTTRTTCAELGVVGSIARPIDAPRIRHAVETALNTSKPRVQSAA